MTHLFELVEVVCHSVNLATDLVLVVLNDVDKAIFLQRLLHARCKHTNRDFLMGGGQVKDTHTHTHTHTHVPSSASYFVVRVPFELGLHELDAALEHLKLFAQLCKVHLQQQKRKKKVKV